MSLSGNILAHILIIIYMALMKTLNGHIWLFLWWFKMTIWTCQNAHIISEYHCRKSISTFKLKEKQRQHVTFVHFIHSWKRPFLYIYSFFVFSFRGAAPMLCIFTVLNICQNRPIFKYCCKSKSWTKEFVLL